MINRRQALNTLAIGAATAALANVADPRPRQAEAGKRDPKVDDVTTAGLNWLAESQSTRGHWDQANYPTAMTALAGTALICSGSTTTQGPYKKQIQKAVDYLVTMSNFKRGDKGGGKNNGLIGDPFRDRQYTYGHGFSMLFLSQVLGEEEDEERRQELIEILTASVQFSGKAQTKKGGWGYVSAQDGSDFDEGSTTITQVQGLRGCRNAGIVVPKEVIERAKQYIYLCKNGDGGISYSSQNMGTSRPAITAAALACLYNAGEYDNKHTKDMLEYCKKNLGRIGDEQQHFGHWHYTYLYYAQVMYRQPKKDWEEFRDRLYAKILSQPTTKTQKGAYWQGNIAPVYVTSCNLIMLQLDKGLLPIYQK